MWFFYHIQSHVVSQTLVEAHEMLNRSTASSQDVVEQDCGVVVLRAYLTGIW